MNPVLILASLFLFNPSPFLADEIFNFSRVNKIIIIPINYSSFFCPLCLNQISSFNDLVNSKNMNGIVVGVVLLREKETEDSIKIIEKKIKGFANSNKIHFPLILDSNCIFKNLDPEEGLIVIDIPKKKIKSFKFPLSPKNVKEVLEEKMENERS